MMRFLLACSFMPRQNYTRCKDVTMTKQWISRDDSTKQVSIPPPAPSTFKFISLGKTEILIICILLAMHWSAVHASALLH